ARRCSTTELFPHWASEPVTNRAPRGSSVPTRGIRAPAGYTRRSATRPWGNPVPVRPLRLLAATTVALLIGCGGGSGDNNGGGSTTVNGQVLDNFGIGRGGVTVIAGGKSTTTDANGHFTVSGIATPYDVVIIAPAPDKAATIYTQLTRTDPKLL